MTVSTNGQICFGILFGEGYEFPWNDPDNPDDQIESWWVEKVHGYKPPFELYDENGMFIGGVRPPEEKIDEYYDHRRAFKKSLPSIPVEEVNYCSGDYPMYILALAETMIKARRGYPIEFDPTELKITEEQIATLREFCEEHSIEYTKPKWWLSSYWG